jgi:hypothetical protein
MISRDRFRKFLLSKILPLLSPLDLAMTAEFINRDDA